MSDEQVPRVVVGVDGSESSKAALRWAMRQAGLIHGTVDAVIAWDYPASYEWAPVIDGGAFSDAAGAALEKAIAEVTGDQSVPVTTIVAEGNPAQVLIDAARGAEILVAGSRGHGAFTSALLGSTSERCVRHATCPVVVIRGAE